MQYVDVAGVRVSKIGLGCWQFGSREWGYGRAYAQDEAIKITNRALDLGINLIDTAEIYGFGQSERIVGRAIAGRRAEAFVATKIWPLMPVAPVVVDRGPAQCTPAEDRHHRPVPGAPSPTPSCPTARRWTGCASCSATASSATSASATTPSIDGNEPKTRSVRPSSRNQVEYNLAERNPDRISFRSPPPMTG